MISLLLTAFIRPDDDQEQVTHQVNAHYNTRTLQIRVQGSYPSYWVTSLLPMPHHLLSQRVHHLILLPHHARLPYIHS